MAQKLKVTYVDGRVETVIVSPKVHVMTERQYSGLTDAHGVELSYYMAWLALHRAGREPVAVFDDFLDLIEEVEQVKDGEIAGDPTTATPPSEGSSNSA